MSQTVLVIGLGRFGTEVARTLAQRGVEVIAVDTEMRHVEALKEEVAQALTLDATDEVALRTLQLETIDAAVVAIGEDLEANIFITALLRKVGIRRIVARASTELHARILSELGAGKVVSVEVQMGKALAEILALPGTLDRIELPTGDVFAEIEPPRSIQGRTIRELDLRARHRINIAAVIQRQPYLDEEGEPTYERRVLNPPDPDAQIGEHDVLAVIARPENLEKFLKGQS